MSAEPIRRPRHRAPLVAAALLQGALAVLPGAARSAASLEPPDLLRVAPGPSVPDLLHDPLQVPMLAGPMAVPPPVCAEPSEGAPPLSLADALALALCRHPQLAQAQAEIEAQAAALGEARAAFWPRLQASVSRQSTTTLSTRSGQSVDQASTARSLALNWRLFDFGTRAGARDGAQRLLAAVGAARDALVQRLMAALVSAYFEAITAQAMVTMREQARAQAREALDTAQRRERHGLVAGSDVLQARAQLARAQLALERASGEAQRAQLTLSSLMGLADGTPLRLPAQLDPAQDEETEDLSRWLDEARARHPSILAAQARLQIARLRVGSVRAEGLPTLDASAARHVDGQPDQGLYASGSRVTTYGLRLTLPLFDGFGHTYRIRGAQAQLAQSEAQLEQARQQVALEVLRAHADALSARRTLPAAAELAQAAEAASVSAARRYDKGVADISELLSSQSLLAEARLEQVRALAGWHAARLRLLAAAGVMQQVEAPAGAVTVR